MEDSRAGRWAEDGWGSRAKRVARTESTSAVRRITVVFQEGSRELEARLLLHLGKGPQQGSQRGQQRQDEIQTSHGKNIKARNSGGSQKSREKRLSPRVGGQYYQIIN